VKIYLYYVHPMGPRGQFVVVHVGRDEQSATRNPSMTIQVSTYLEEDLHERLKPVLVRVASRGPLYVVDASTFDRTITNMIREHKIHSVVRHTRQFTLR
jgi:hypothetical protein